MEIDWAAWVVPCISGAFGVGLTWGTLKQRIDANCKRLDKMETKLDEQVGGDNCLRIRTDCHTTLEKRFDRLDASNANIFCELKSIAIWMAKHNGD
jgi:hypothetical protein